MLTFLFPGQGSQSRGMGAELFDEFSEYTREADKILGYSIKSLCLDSSAQQLNQTQFTQPALYVVNALTYYKKLKDTKQKPDFAAGHSLGEYNALLAADVFDFQTGLQLVKKRGELMSQATGGGMAAVIGLTLDHIKQILQENGLNNLSVANHNSYTQIVISGPKSDIDRAQPLFETIPSTRFIPLAVSGAFHSPYMISAQQHFMEFLNSFEFSMPTMPVIANIDAAPYHPAIIKSNLAKQMTHAVQWTSMMEYLLLEENIVLEEIGPGNVLTGLLRRIRNGQ